jgi:hypothetical protein
MGIPVPGGLGGLLGGGLLGGNPFSGFFGAFGNMIWGWIVSAATAIFAAVVNAINQSGPINFSGGSWWAAKVGLTNSGTNLWATVIALSLAVMLCCVIFAAIQGAIQGEPMMAIKAVFVGVPTSIFGIVVVVAFTTVLVGVVDAASSAVLSGLTPNFKEWFSTTAGFMPGLVMFIGELGGLLLWMELILRAGFIYLFVLLSPMALAVRVWPAMGGFFRRYAEIGVALIVSKFVIAAALALGSAALAGGSQDPGSAAGIAAMATGAGLMLVSAFSPFVILRMVHGIEGALAHQGLSHAPGRAAMTAINLATSALLIGRLAAGSGGGGAGAGGGGGGGGGGDVIEPAKDPKGPGSGLEVARGRNVAGPTGGGTGGNGAQPAAPAPQPLPPGPGQSRPIPPAPAPPQALPPARPPALPPPSPPPPSPPPPAAPTPTPGQPRSFGSSGVFIDVEARPVPAHSDRSGSR